LTVAAIEEYTDRDPTIGPAMEFAA
jgi:hypothetical protein